VDGIRQKFTSQERDSETGLDYMHARYFASAQGRFSSADSVAGSIGNPQSLNRYAYVGNNPLNFSDPTGHDRFSASSNGFAETMGQGGYMSPEDPDNDDPTGLRSRADATIAGWSAQEAAAQAETNPSGGHEAGHSSAATDPDINGIRTGLQDALKKPGCKEFVQSLLDAVKTKKNPLEKGGDIMALFESVVAQGRITRIAPLGSAGYGNPIGNIAKGDAAIFQRGGARTSTLQLIFDTEGTFHELMHFAGSKRYYTDRQFAEAVHNNPAYKSRSPYPPDTPQLRGELKDPGAIGWGAYWNDVLKQKCFENH
jgi:RHS repeat-associated protein